MLISYILLILSSNAVTLRRDKSILYSRVLLFMLIYSFLILLNLNMTLSDIGIGSFGGLIQATSLRQSFNCVLQSKGFSLLVGFMVISLYMLEVVFPYIKTVKEIALLFRLFMASILLPFGNLYSALISEVQSIILATFFSSNYYKSIEKCYYNNGLLYLLNKLAIDIHTLTTNYLRHNFYDVILFQCVCIYSASSGNDFWLIISLFHLIIHLPFLIISILTYVFIIRKDFYKEHPYLFWFSLCVCALLFIVFVILLVILYYLILQLIDDYILQMNKNDGNSGDQGSGSGKGREPGDGSGPQGGPGGENRGPYDTIGSEQDKKNKKRDKRNEIQRISRSNRTKEKKDLDNKKQREDYQKKPQEKKDLDNKRKREDYEDKPKEERRKGKNEARNNKRANRTDEEKGKENEARRIIWADRTDENREIRNQKDRDRRENRSVEQLIRDRDKDIERREEKKIIDRIRSKHVK